MGVRAMVLGLALAFSPVVVFGEPDPDDFQVVGRTSYGGQGPYTGSDPDISQRQLAVYADLLGLDAEQRELLVLTHESYGLRYERLWLTMAEQISDLEAEMQVERDASGESRSWVEINAARDEITERFREGTAQERERLHDEVRLLLTPEQLEAWDRVEHYLRRDRFFGRSLGYNANTTPDDLVDALETLRAVRAEAAGLDEAELTGLTREGLPALNGSAASVVRSFEAQLDGMIDRYESLRGAVEREMNPAGREPASSAEEWQARDRRIVVAVLRAHEAGVDMVTATRRFEREIRAVLPSEVSAAFAEAMLDRLVPGTSAALREAGRETTRFELMLERAGELTAEQRRAVDGIDAERSAARDETLRAFAPMIERERERLARREALGDRDAMGQIEVNYPNGAVSIALKPELRDEQSEDDEDPNKSERARMSMRLFEIEQEAVDRLRDVLTEEQRMAAVRR